MIDGETVAACNLADGQILTDPQVGYLLNGMAAAFMQSLASDLEVAETSLAENAVTVAPFNPAEEIVGGNGSIRLRNGLIEITRQLKDDIAFGNLRGTKAIPIRSIQAVQFKRATFVPGAIEFVVAGDRSNTADDRRMISNSPGFVNAMFGKQMARNASENTVTFTRAMEPPFVELHEYVLSLIGTPDRATPSEPVDGSPNDLVAQLERLAGLHRAGALSGEEFAHAKSRLISGS